MTNNLKSLRTLITLFGTAMAAHAAIQRIRQARHDEDRFELLDAAVNIAAVTTGILVIVRRLRRGEDA